MSSLERGRRIYHLRPWLIRVLVPPRRSGVYALYRDSLPTYVGRSDRDLRNRLLAHAAAGRDRFFEYETTPDVAAAFVLESAWFHTMRERTRNRIHPAIPEGTTESCPFCADVFADMRKGRFLQEIENLLNAPSAETDLSAASAKENDHEDR